jgi:tRNA nucleotidyltransferase/poly(A) polymerase
MFDSLVSRLHPFSHEFTSRGKQIHLVGGAVRNLLLGRPAKDFDFTTDALPEEVMTYFTKVLPTGLKHGTVTVLFHGEPYEVTTFRVDGGYTDGRRPDSVAFTPSLEEDLKRRDFTINAIALNLADGTLTDPHDGQGDLQRRVLRTVGTPGERFDEDALRLLRLFRFAAQLDFFIDEATLSAVPSRRPRLMTVSRERIREELTKAMNGPSPDLAWGPLAELGFLSDVFAPLNPISLSSSSLARLRSLSRDLRWPWWLSVACGPPQKWEDVLRKLTFSNADISLFTEPARALEWLDKETVPIAAKAIITAWGSRERTPLGVDYLTAIETEHLWNDQRGLKAEIVRAANSGEPLFLNELAVGGQQLIEAGAPRGPRIGELLKILQREVWASPKLNDPERLLERTKSLL